MVRVTTLGEILSEILSTAKNPAKNPKRSGGALDFAVVGLGEAGLTHINLYRELKHNVVAVAELSKERVEKNLGRIKDTFGLSPEHIFTGTSGFDELLDFCLGRSSDPKWGGVSVCTPPYVREHIVSKLLEGGLDLLVEIPLAANLDDARHILEHAAKSGSVTAMPYPWRQAYPIIKLKEAMLSKMWGELKEAKFTQQCNIDYADGTWRNCPEKGGGPIMDHLAHQINYLRYIFGERRLSSVEAKGVSNDMNPRVHSKVYVKYNFGGDVVDTVSIYDGHLGTAGPYKPSLEIECKFEEGRFVSSIDWTSSIFLGGSPFFRVSFNGEELTGYADKHGSHEDVHPDAKYSDNDFWAARLHRNAIKNFIQSLQGNTVPYVPLEEGLKDLKVAFAIRESLETGGEVEVKY